MQQCVRMLIATALLLVMPWRLHAFDLRLRGGGGGAGRTVVLDDELTLEKPVRKRQIRLQQDEIISLHDGDDHDALPPPPQRPVQTTPPPPPLADMTTDDDQVRLHQYAHFDQVQATATVAGHKPAVVEAWDPHTSQLAHEIGQQVLDTWHRWESFANAGMPKH